MSAAESWLSFIKEVENLKNIRRSAWTSDGSQETTAAHSWRLALMAGLLSEEDAYGGLNSRRVLMMALVHDLGELYDGDISAVLRPDPGEKYETEKAAVCRAVSMLEKKRQEEILELWEEYERGETAEARFVKALDKAETIIQHNQGQNPPDFDYEFNLEYGKPYFQEEGLLRELRERIDGETREKCRRERE